MIRLRVYATDGRWSSTALPRANLTPRQAWQWVRRNPGWQWRVPGQGPGWDGWAS